MHKIGIIVLLALFLLSSRVLLLKLPPVWPDEAIYADVVMNMINEGRMGSDLWQDAIPGMRNGAVWNPPVFFYILYLWFKIVGLSIAKQRLLSVIFTVAFIAIMYRFSKLFIHHKKKWLPVILIGIVLVDYVFSHWGFYINRPEIIVLTFGLFSLYFFQKNLSAQKMDKSQTYNIIASGIFASAAALTHFIGVLFYVSILISWIVAKGFSAFKNKNLYIFSVVFIIPIFLWFITSILPNMNLFLQQISMAVSRKQGDPSSLLYSLIYEISEPQIILYGQLLLGLLMTFFVLKQKKTKYVLVAVTLIISWFFAYNGKMEAYWLYPISFTYLGTTILLADDKFRHKFFTVLVYGVIVFTNFSIRWRDFIPYQNQSFYSYDIFSEKILETVPDNTAVFISSIPDPYFAFKKYNRKNILYMSPAFNIKKEDYLKILHDTDYIIYTSDYSSIVHGDFLRRYIEQNVESEYAIGSYKQYEAQIFKLKDRNLRAKPVSNE